MRAILNNAATGCLLLLACRQASALQAAGPSTDTEGRSGMVSKVNNLVFDYLGMAGTHTGADFTPLSQGERNSLFARSLINPVLYFKGAMSGALDFSRDKPPEWGQGASGYGMRVGNIMGQYAIQRTVTFGLSSALHEDNRYFGSGKKKIWSRTAYAVSGSILSRHDNGKRYISASLISGFAAGAFVSRTWQPVSSRSAGDGAVSFGISMGFNALTCVLKEFLPDVVRPLTKGRKAGAPRDETQTPD